MTSLYFDEAEIGQLRTAGPYLVSSEEIVEFARKYDPQPFHTDEEAAARSAFAGLTASGAHTFAILISLLSKTQPYSLRIIAGLGWDELRLPIPVRPGDELNLEVAILVLLSQKVAVSGLRESVKLHVSERAEHGSTTVIR